MKFENRPEIFDGLIGGCVKPVVNFNDNLVYSLLFLLVILHNYRQYQINNCIILYYKIPLV